MKRCKHLNGEFLEDYVEVLNKPVENGVCNPVGIFSGADLSGTWRFCCHDCKKEFSFGMDASKYPKWFLKYYLESVRK